MKSTLTVLAVCLVMAISGIAYAADPLTIVNDGASDYTIVLDTNASPSEQWASQELVDHLKQMSGAQLKVQKGGAAPAKAIVLGFGPAADALGVKDDGKLGDDGYVIKTTGDSLVIAGSRVRGTLYGVYTLLESLGVRWWYLDESYVPALKTVTVPATDLRDVPKLEYRDMMFSEMFSDAGRLWAARNKVNGMAWDDVPEKLGGRYRVSGNLVHSYMTLLKESGEPITEDMMSLVNGKRTTPGSDASQPCLSNPKVLAATVKAVVARFKKDPTLRFVVVGQMDNGNYCRCPDCAAIDEKEGSHAGQVIRFANEVAEQVDKQIPGACICTAAYEWSRHPPKNLKPDPNVYITLCSIECDFSHPLAAASNPENMAFKEDIEGWGKIANKILIWHYVGNRDHYLMPNPEIETLQPNMKFFADNKCAGVFNQGTHVGQATDMAPLKMWVLAKSMWNPDLDGRKLIEEFCNSYYGPAAPDVLKYIDIMASTAHQQQYHNGRRVDLNAPFLKPEIIADAEETLRHADAAVKDNPALARHVRHVHLGIWYVLAKRGPGSATWQAVEKKVGKLDFNQIAASIQQVVTEYKINRIDDPDLIGPWLDWLKQYAAQSAKAPVIPPELAGVDPATYRVIQACQLDGRPGWWKPADGASDGWAAYVPGPGWYTKIAFMPGEDFTPGKTYRLYVRAKGQLAPDAAGNVWEFGVYPKGPSTKIDQSKLADAQWHVFDLGPFKPTDGQFWWTAMIRGAGQNTAVIDCIWLREVPAP